MTLFLGVSLTGFAQMKTPDQAVKDAHKAFIGDIQKGLVDKKAGKPNFGDAYKGMQFLLEGNENTLEAFSIKPNKVGLKAVYQTLRGLGKVTSYATPTPRRQSDKDVVSKDGKLKKAFFETRDDVYTFAQNGDATSDVEYTVTFGWEVKITSDSVKKASDVTLVSVAAEQKPYTRNEIASMQAAAQKAIADWYAELPSNLDKKYADEAVGLTAMTVGRGNINGSLNGKSYTSTEVPDIKINVPFKVKPEEGAFYDANPMATYQLTPTFTVTINNDLKTAKVTDVKLVQGATKNPIDNGTKEARKKAALAVAQNFGNKLSAYVENPTMDKTELENMFVDKKSVVEVSNVSKQGFEKITTRPVDQYFTRLKATGMQIVLGTPIESGNMEEIVYPFNQGYDSKTYSDYTDKELHLKYINGTYLIEKIAVKPNSTRLK